MMKYKFIDDYIEKYQKFLRTYDSINYNYSKLAIGKEGKNLGLKEDEIEEILTATKSKKFNKFLEHYQKKDDETWEFIEHMFKRYYNDDYHIIWGFYTILDSDSKSLLYLVSNDFNVDNKDMPNVKAFWNFEYIPIPTKIGNIAKVEKAISEDSNRFLDKGFYETPTIYRANSWMSDSNRLKELYTNTYIQELNNSSSFNVVLGEEVLFFLYGYMYLKKTEKAAIWKNLYLKKNYKSTTQITPHLKQLSKFALSVEAKFGTKNDEFQLHVFFDLLTSKEKWKTVKENEIREEVDAFIDIKLVTGTIDDFLNQLDPVITTVFDTLVNQSLKFINEIENGEILTQLEEKFILNRTNNLDLWKFIARFNLEASILLLKETKDNILHDVFMFPMIKSWKETTQTKNLAYEDCLKKDSEVVLIDIPVIMTTYIDSLYSINGTLDEDESSLNGFNITMEVCKNLAKPIVESEFYGRVIKSKLLPQAIKSAISQVMARNSSHNIGSHVMNKLINGKTLKHLNLVELYSEKSKDKKFNYHSLIEIETLREEAETYHQLAIFNNYVKCRMDYLSDITFGTPLMQTTKKVYDLFEELDKVRLLLENISGLSDFKYSILFTEGKDSMLITKDSVLSLALPNDILGCQALYNIIENVIRNTAKHGNGPGKELLKAAGNKFVFTINIKEIEEDVLAEVQCGECYEVEIFDNIPVNGDKKLELKEKQDYIDDINKHKNKDDATLTLDSKVTNIEYLVYNQNKKLNESILQDNNSLRASGLGLIEMEASASYLRKLDISNIESDAYNIDYNDTIYNKASYNLNIVKAFKAGKEENYLGYRFFMLRPAEVLVVTDSELKEVNTRDWLKRGVKIIGINDFNTSLEGGVVYNHQFLLYDNDSVKEKIDFTVIREIDGEKYALSIYKTLLPLRILKIETSEIVSLFATDFQSMELKLWKEWEKQFNDTGTTLRITNDKPEKNSTTFTRFVIFDHVGEDESDYEKLRIQEIFSNAIGYYEALSTKAQLALPNFSKLSKCDDPLIKPLKVYLPKLTEGKDGELESKKIFESCINKIIVIDERVQAACDELYMKIPFKQLYEKSRISIPNDDKNSKELNLGALSYDEALVTEIKKYISSIQLSKKSDFLIFHYSILERMFANPSQDKLVLEINNYLDILSTKINVVITSGRGTPKNLTKTVRFVNLSPILSALVEVRSKYLINGILNSSRKSNDI